MARAYEYKEIEGFECKRRTGAWACSFCGQEFRGLNARSRASRHEMIEHISKIMKVKRRRRAA
jgi:hypothetical protein